MSINKELVCSFDLESFGLHPDWSLLLCGSLKPWGKPPKTYRLDDYPGKYFSDDSKLVEVLVSELSRYFILIAHYGRMHDRLYLNSKAVKYGLTVLNPRGRLIDPFQLAKNHMKLSSNSLAAVSGFLGVKSKKTPIDNEAWHRAAFDHDRPSMDIIVKHCEVDTIVLEEIMTPLIPFVGDINRWGSA